MRNTENSDIRPPGIKGGHSLSKNPRVDKGPQPLMFNPALTTCASERMKTQRFSYFADFAARERMREAKREKKSQKWASATFAKNELTPRDFVLRGVFHWAILIVNQHGEVI